MPECHKCKLAGTAACLTCPGPSEDSRRGVNLVRLTNHNQLQALPSEGHLEPVTNLPVETEDALRLFVHFLVQLDPRDLLLLQAVMARRSLSELGRELGLTHQGMSYRLAQLVRRHPELTFLKELVNGR